MVEISVQIVVQNYKILNDNYKKEIENNILKNLIEDLGYKVINIE